MSPSSSSRERKELYIFIQKAAVFLIGETTVTAVFSCFRRRRWRRLMEGSFRLLSPLSQRSAINIDAFRFQRTALVLLLLLLLFNFFFYCCCCCTAQKDATYHKKVSRHFVICCSGGDVCKTRLFSPSICKRLFSLLALFFFLVYIMQTMTQYDRL